MSRLELPVVFLALAAVDWVQLAITHTRDLLTHPLWLDEVLTSRLANDPSFGHMLHAIRGGVETNPPTMYLLLWPLAKLPGPLGNVQLRLIAMLAMLIALTTLYAILRRSFSRVASAIGVMTVASHPLIISLTYEARFYAPWLMLTLAYCLAILRNDERRTAGRTLAIYLLAILVATIHYFGIISLTLITLADLIVHRSVRRALPLLAGAIAIGACFPFYQGQRAGLSVKTWIDPLNASDLRDGLIALFGAPSFLFIAIAASLVIIFRSYPSLRIRGEVGRGVLANCETETHNENVSPNSASASLLLISLIAFPFLIIAFSIVVQPAFVARYLILAIAPLGLIAAFWSQLLNRKTSILILIALFVIGAAELVAKSHAARGLDAGFTDTLAAIRAQTGPDDRIVFKRRREMYPVLQLDPSLAGRARQLDFVDDPSSTSMSKYERDIGRKVSTIYSDFQLISADDLHRAGQPFFIVVPSEELDELRVQLRNFAIEPSATELHRVRPNTPPT